jgi:superfamily II DNA or RNA helicase
MATFDDFYKLLPEDSGKRGEFFERVFAPWFLKIDPEWSNQIKAIWLWEEYPQRWGKDCGIDLVYEDKGGRHWAVQCKCVSPDREISKAEIDSFLSESNDSRIYGRLLIATTDGIGKNAQQVIDRQEKQVICFLLEHFQTSAVEFPSNPYDLTSGRRKDRSKPRHHQEEAISDVIKGFQVNDRGQLLMACGTGKTLTSLWISERVDSNLSLVLVPSLSLLSQTLRAWIANSTESFNWICVCSDQSVAKRNRSEDYWIEQVSELGVPVTSDIKEIQSFLFEKGKRVVFSTYQSSPLIAQAQEGERTPSFDLAIADEAHRCAGKVSSAFGCILEQEKIRSARRLFMTATPRVLSNQLKKKATENDIEIASMDDEAAFGKVLHRLSFSKAIKLGLLSDYRIIIVGVDDATVEEKIHKRTIAVVDGDHEIDYSTLASHIALAKSIQDHNLECIITFHGRVSSAREFASKHSKIHDYLIDGYANGSKKIAADYISGEMSALQRNKRINQLRSKSEDEICILSNARCLTEGVDVPALSGIAFIEPRSSQVDIIQAVGRAIRHTEDKSYGYILLPVYLGSTVNIEQDVLASRFADIWKVLLAIKSQDDLLSDTLDRLRLEVGASKEYRKDDYITERILIDLPASAIRILGDSLHALLVKETTDNWMEMYGRLLQYTNQHGEPNPGEDNIPLKNWVGNQRANYKRGLLSKERVILLERISNWIWDILEHQWNQQYAELTDYVQENKEVPLTSHPTLGNWVAAQRSNYSNGTLRDDRITLLEKVEGWVWDPQDTYWQVMYQKLVDFMEQTGHACPLQSEPGIGQWTSTQRKNYANKCLSQDKVILLEELKGWVWDTKETYWQEQYQALFEYTNQHGSACPPTLMDGVGKWASTQRGNYARGTLSQEKIELLERLDGWYWNKNDGVWREKYEELARYQSEHNDSNPPREMAIGKWVSNQRTNYRTGKLDSEKILMLEKIPSWTWNAEESRWQDNYDKLASFTSTSGHARPTAADNPALSSWVSTQRKNYEKNLIAPDKQSLLEKLDGWTWNPIEDSWQEQYNRLHELAIANGHLNSLNLSKRMSGWISLQRKNHKKGILDEDKKISLEKIRGWSWNSIKSKWDEMYEELKGFAEQHGHARVLTSEPGLGAWVSRQRAKYLNNTLTEEEIRLLEDVTGWIWGDPKDVDWQEKYDALSLYSQETGISSPKKSHPLGVWVSWQRTHYRRGNLSKEKIDLLEQLPNWRWRVR